MIGRLLLGARKGIAQTASFGHRTATLTAMRLPLRCNGESPVFVIGCPRSGTTFLGRVLGLHPDVKYLNEPKWLWAKVCPETDSYGIFDASKASIELTARSATAPVCRRARRAFWLLRGGARTLVEKTPDNGARIPWLAAIFPRSKFVHIIRDPHDTALSLKKALVKWFPDGWTGTPQYQVWERHVQRSAAVASLWKEAVDDYERALIVWREINRLASLHGSALGEDRYVLVRYEDVVMRSNSELCRIACFAGLRPSREYLDRCDELADASSVGKPCRDALRIRRFLGGDILDRFSYT